MLFVSAIQKHGRLLVIQMVVVERKWGGHGMLPFFASSLEGKWAEKNILRHQRGDKKIKIP